MNSIKICLVAFSWLALFFSTASFAQEKKPFPAYLEFSFGQGENAGVWPYEVTDTYDTNISFKGVGASTSDTEIEEISLQMVTLGWKFPRDKGKIIASYYDFKENNSDTVINHSLIISDQLVPDEWYDPNWDYDYSDGVANYLIKMIDDDLGMETRVVDAAFSKDFGKTRKISGSWNTGLRWMKHEQTVPIGYYFPYISPDSPDSYIPIFSPTPLLLNQESSSVGIKGGIKLLYHLFRKRLVLSAALDVSMTVGENDLPTHYITRIRDSYDESYNIIRTYEDFPFSEKRDKTYWFDMVDLNAKVRIVQELYLFVGYKLAHFRDVFLNPNLIVLPTPKENAPYGLFVSYVLDDISYGVPYIGLSYQF
ncbi:MAG: hypothetical protein AB1756_03840 [Acidobacteriota bacterium]